jgi:eukaryotic-like serine/threonine-protein kinase
VVHRDIKPANIMVLSDGPVKITDFGIARMRASNDELTQSGMMLGSPKYMSPEQVIGKRADHRSDIFSLGVILYETLTGSAPFSGENVTALMYQIVNFAPPAPSAVNPAVPELLNFIVAKMLAKPLEERYQSAQDLANDLRNCERQIASPATITQPLRPLGLGAAGLATAGGLAAGTQPELALSQAQSVVMAQTLNRTRQDDSNRGEGTDPPARGLAHSFDSAEATQRLAALTGASTTLSDSVSATQAMSSLQPPESRGWRRRDWLLVGGALLLGLLIATAILRA